LLLELAQHSSLTVQQQHTVFSSLTSNAAVDILLAIDLAFDLVMTAPNLALASLAEFLCKDPLLPEERLIVKISIF